MVNPTLSIIMTNYNHGKFLRQSVHAILDQSYEPYEFIIIDDASTDDSVEILKDFAGKYSMIRLINNDTNRGVVYNAERLIALAKGHYVYWAAADDQILPGFFEKSMNLLSQYPQAGLCSSFTWCVDEQGNHKRMFPTPLVSKNPCYISPERALGILMKHGPWIQGNTVIHRREALLAMGGYRQGLGAYSDAFVAETSALNYGACFIPEALSVWRILETSYSSQFGSNLDESVAIINGANLLRLTEFRDLYSDEYVNKWASSQLCSILRMRWDSHVENFIPEISRIFPCPSATIAFSKALLRVTSMAYKTLVTVLLGNPMWNARIAFRKAIYKMKTSSEKIFLD